VGDPHKDVAGFVVFLFQVLLEQFRKGFVSGFVALNDFRIGFVYR